MSHDPLDSLLKLRKKELDEAMMLLSQAQNLAIEAANAVRLSEQKLIDEHNAALDFAADDLAVEAYSRWLPVGRMAVNNARDAEQNAAQDVETARANVVLARTTLKTSERLKEIRAAEALTKEQKQEQDALDDFVSQRSKTD